jgi:ubiquinone/menaquinone biosynthesis C-methylase UbiE
LSTSANVGNGPTLAQVDAPDIETASEDYARRFEGKVGNYFLEFQAGIVLKMLEPNRNPAILDIGGGHAQLTVPLVKSGYNVTVTGSDTICRRRLDSRLPPGSFRFQTANLRHLPFPNEAFDVVMAFRLLTHLENWQMLLAEICRVSKNTIILDYPDVRSVNYFSESLFGTKKAIEGNTRPFRLFARRQVLDTLEAHGFGQAVLRPQFVLPMVVHRMVGSVGFTKCVETICRFLGLRCLFGSPIILKATRLKAQGA